MVSVLLPTTGRPAMARRCLELLVDTVEGHDVEVIAAVDCDPDTEQELLSTDRRRVALFISSADRYRGCSKAWNDALAMSRGDPVVFAADDLIWQPGWLDAALDKLAEFDGGWGMVGFNDGHWDGNDLATHYLMSRRFIIDVLGGVVAWEFYRHSFNDLEVNQRSRAAGRYAWAPDAKVLHEHWLFGTRPQDHTDTRTLAEWGASRDRYEQRRAAGFPVDYPPVIVA